MKVENRHTSNWPPPPFPQDSVSMWLDKFANAQASHLKAIRDAPRVAKLLESTIVTASQQMECRLAILAEKRQCISHLLDHFVQQLIDGGRVPINNKSSLPRRRQIFVFKGGRVRLLLWNFDQKTLRCSRCGGRSKSYRHISETHTDESWCVSCVRQHKKEIRTWVKRWAQSATAKAVTAIVAEQRAAETNHSEMLVVRSLAKLLPKVRRAVRKLDRDALQSLKKEFQEVGNLDH